MYNPLLCRITDLASLFLTPFQNKRKGKDGFPAMLKITCLRRQVSKQSQNTPSIYIYIYIYIHYDKLPVSDERRPVQSTYRTL